jgi:hypothetical protein
MAPLCVKQLFGPGMRLSKILQRSNEYRTFPLLLPIKFALMRQLAERKKGSPMFLILAVVLVILWLGGFFVLHVSSFLIHLLLIFAVISIIMNFVSGKRAV